MMRRLLAFLLACGLILPFAPSAGASNQPTVALRVGFGGVVRGGAWSPVEVDVSNPGPQISGDVQIILPEQQYRSYYSRTGLGYDVPVFIPPHVTKRVTTAVFLPPLVDHLDAHLVVRGQTVATVHTPLKRAGPSDVLCGVLSGDQLAYDALQTIPLATGRQARIAHLDLPDLPTSPQLLSTLDCLIISNYSTAGFSPEQQMALSTWVDNGGVLTIGTGPNGQATTAGLPADLLPAHQVGTAPIRSLTGLNAFFNQHGTESGPWLAANLHIDNGASVISEEGQPLLVVGRRGKGVVFELALNPADTPLRTWSGIGQLWTYVLAYVPPSSAPAGTFYQSFSGWGRMPRVALADLHGISQSAAKTLTLGFVLFAVLLGPVALVLLQRTRRRELALVLVPLLATGATIGSIRFAQTHQAGDMLLNQVTIVRSWNGSGIGLTHSYVGLYALHTGKFSLALPPDSVASRLFFGFLFGRRPDTVNDGNWTLETATSGQSKLVDLPLSPSEVSLFSLDGMSTHPGRVASSLQLHDRLIKGTVTNQLGLPIHQAMLLAGNSAIALGDLSPGKSVPVSLALEPDTPLGADNPAGAANRLVTTGEILPRPYDSAQRDILESAIDRSFRYSSPLDLGSVSLIGWINSSPAPISSIGRPADQVQRTLFITDLGLTLPIGRSATVPTALLSQQRLDSNSVGQAGQRSLVLNPSETLAFGFTIPFAPGHFAVDQLLTNVNGSGPPTGTLSFWDWRANRWVGLVVSNGLTSISSPERFVSAIGTIRVRFQYQPPNGQPLTLTRFQLQIHGSGQ